MPRVTKIRDGIDETEQQLFNIPALIRRITKEVVKEVSKSGSQRWPEYMTIETAAEYINRTPDAMRGIAERHELPICRIDARVQFRRTDLDRYMERHTQ